MLLSCGHCGRACAAEDDEVMRAKRERIPFAMPSISAAAAAAAVRRCVMPTPSESFLRSEEEKKVKRATETCDAP
jgi:hypothetical protein